MAFLDQKDIDAVNRKIRTYEEYRESLVLLSREVLKLSKQMIYAAHRQDLAAAKVGDAAIRKKISEMQVIVAKDVMLISCGSYKIAVQEYVEAVAFLAIREGKSVPSCRALKVPEEYFLLGLCDLVGEIVRDATNACIRGEYGTAHAHRELVADIYGQLLKIDARDGELRKKIDGVRYDLQKLEDLVLDLKLKGKV